MLRWREYVYTRWHDWIVKSALPEEAELRAFDVDSAGNEAMDAGTSIPPQHLVALLGLYQVKNDAVRQMPAGADPDRDAHEESGLYRMAHCAYLLGFMDAAVWYMRAKR